MGSRNAAHLDTKTFKEAADGARVIYAVLASAS